ncbi:hypothetical protein CP10139811_0127 [Chlamydia ibidis]|uniref:DUF721 domain-containing protein n=2 Tax=Chlamydia ibidis TaxID=1405396 RepID=S7J4E5_9CHLA|nr:DUF721 domain-containing protein [Chlamydia ibidis]EPP35098.1 hypothetical protein CP10139811_0127 [Chlamydia ibidis]EQM62610.1 hypothetical protein H359_0569 [Chlamydia ibidis 10-1398/6]
MFRPFHRGAFLKKQICKKTDSTIKHANHYLPQYLKYIKRILSTKPKEVIEAWNEIMGREYNGMFRVLGFKDRVLLVKVYNSSLYAVWKQTPQSSLIARLNEIVPQTEVKEIQFLLG